MLLCFLAPEATAQTTPAAKKDSLLSYDLAEIVVSDGSIFATHYNTVQSISVEEISRQNAVSVSELARLIPAAHVQTNSRGESLIYIRNAAERQIALFYNGALLNIPWDNRMNLDLVPANVIGKMTVTKGAPSVLYGTNVLGGAINITSRTLDYDGSLTEFNGQVGELSTTNVALSHILSKGGFRFTAAAGYSSRDGQSLPPISLYSQQSSSVRSNTDREILNFFGQGSYRLKKGAEVGLSYLLIDGDFGIAPEGHLDPAESSVRYWRYPKFSNAAIVFNASVPLDEATVIRGAAWGNWFKQHIDSFISETYEDREAQQQDDDETFGGRITLNRQIGDGQLSVALNGLQSEHREITLETNEEGILDAEEGASPELFKQFIFSAGLEYAMPLTENVRMNLGGSLDGIATPETGDKPSRDAQTALGVSGGFQYKLTSTWLLRASAGRKVRFPTMRELFGVALNRFLLNPDLRPESSFVSEVALVNHGTSISGEVIGFYQRSFDTIDQENVVVDGASLRRRINLDGSRVVGVEFVGIAHPTPALKVNGHLTVMKPRGMDGDETIYLTEKPSVLGSLSMVVNSPRGISLTGEAIYTGRAYGRNEENEFVPLVKSLVIDAKAAYKFSIRRGSVYNELFFRVDNIFNQETLPQLGLPGAGRLISVGLNVAL